MTIKRNTKHPKRRRFKSLQMFPIFFLVEWIVGGKVLHAGTTVGVSEVREDWFGVMHQWSVWFIPRDGRNLQWKLPECHRVGRCRVSWEPLVACSPAVSVCPPYPERAPPPLSELLPWRWCRFGRTWWSSLLHRKVVEGEKGENMCFYTTPHVFMNFNVSCINLSVPQIHGSITSALYYLDLALLWTLQAYMLPRYSWF